MEVECEGAQKETKSRGGGSDRGSGIRGAEGEGRGEGRANTSIVR